MKSLIHVKSCNPSESPSTRREWIEIPRCVVLHRGDRSPSTRREWIEMPCHFLPSIILVVSLHTEGVD